MEEQIRRMLTDECVSDVGFAVLPDGELSLTYAVSLVVRLSSAVVDTITTEPTLDYFLHYRTVNAFLDRCSLKTALLLENAGYSAIPVGASQSFPQRGGFAGRYSHKKAAVCAGLGVMGKSNLFLHRKWGPRVRLATVLTDCPFPGVYSASPVSSRVLCGECGRCAARCPSGAITSAGFQPAVCSVYLKEHFQHIGRGAVCGICMQVCPEVSP